MKIKTLFAIVCILVLCARIAHAEDKTVLRFGHFPNITHALSQHKGWFEERLGTKID